MEEMQTPAAEVVVGEVLILRRDLAHSKGSCKSLSCS